MSVPERLARIAETLSAMFLAILIASEMNSQLPSLVLIFFMVFFLFLAVCIRAAEQAGGD